MPRIIALSGSRHQNQFLNGIPSLLKAFADRGFSLRFHSRFFGYLTENGIEMQPGWEAMDRPDADIEAVISLGGDGTFLRTAQWLGGLPVPMLGINTGHLGFLTHYDLDDAAAIAEALYQHKFTAEQRSLLAVSGQGIPAHIWPYALNEVAILKEDTSSMITVHTELDGYFLADYLADGLIISTPTGSTGYNLSVGGPIMQPTIDCRVISPIAPHSLTMRPLVIGADSEVAATTTSRAHTYRISLDGRSFVMTCGSQVKVSRAPFGVFTLRLESDNFPSVLRRKLHWAVR